MDTFDTILNQLVMEARGRKKKDTDINVSDQPAENEDVPNIDYGEGAPTDDEPNAPEDQTAPGGIDVSDQPTGDEPAAGPEQGADAAAGTDYGEGMPDDEGGGGETGEEAPPEDAGGEENPDAAANANPEQEDQGTDYGADAPTGDEDQPEQEGDPNATQGDQPPPEGQEEPPAEDGEDTPPEEVGGEEGEDAPAEGVDETNEDSANRKNANNILLLRSFIRLHKEIRLIAKKITESRKQSLLATVTYKQVCDNLNTLRGMVYKYILLEYDNSSYEENVYNFNYFIEILEYNYEMLKKVKEIQDKASVLANKSSKRKQNKKSKKPTSS